jgi:hypothetical protein
MNNIELPKRSPDDTDIESFQSHFDKTVGLIVLGIGAGDWKNVLWMAFNTLSRWSYTQGYNAALDTVSKINKSA